MLITVRDRIDREIKEEKNLAAFSASQLMRDFDSAWGKGFLKPEQFVRIVYDSLVKENSQVQYHGKVEFAL